jgi:hypothetical protein
MNFRLNTPGGFMGSTTNSVMMFLKPADFIVFVLSGALGYVVASLLPEGPWSPYVAILVSYHLFLVWLVVNASHKTGFSLPIGSTILTHLACLTVVVALPYIRHSIPMFGLIRYCIPAMAPFERMWLFSAEGKKEAAPIAALVSVTDSDVIAEATVDDNEAWLEYLAQPNRPYRKPGTSVGQEYEQWLAARIKKRS